ADPEALATHFLASGDIVRAGQYAARAARSAAEALAFDRAARLYRLALELAQKDAPARPQIQIDLAMSLANSGRGAEAGPAFVAPAATAPPAQALDLQRRAAEQFLTSGRIREGIVTLRGVLDAIGMRMATTPRRALARLLLGRARIRLRGLSWRERAAIEI